MIQYIQANFLDLLASVIGLLFLYFEFKANINMWLVSILMAILFIYTFWSTQLYASMCIYIYFMLASIYGWLMWLKDRKQQKTEGDIIYRLPKQKILQVIAFVAIAFGIIFWILSFADYTIINLRIGDALTTSFNVISLWMLSRKWAEQWLLLIPANIISGLLLFHQTNYATAIMFFVYAIVSLIGYIYWCKLAKAEIIQ